MILPSADIIQLNGGRGLGDVSESCLGWREIKCIEFEVKKMVDFIFRIW